MFYWLWFHVFILRRRIAVLEIYVRPLLGECLILITWRKYLILDFDPLQDLSQPKSEACPPDGVLSVSLLKHQVHMFTSF